MPTRPCQNFNHSRVNPPVCFCPSCGDVVNTLIGAKQCSDVAHASARKQRTRYCVDCGERLIAA